MYTLESNEKHSKKQNLDGNLKKKLPAVLNESWMQYTANKLLYSHFHPIFEITRDEQVMMDTAVEVRINS